MSGPPVTVTEDEQVPDQCRDESDSDHERPHVPGTKCLHCEEVPITYMARPCDHPLFCKKCAMKFATGGKCMTCHKLYTELARMLD